MHKYFYIYNIRVPAYGLIVMMGILICNCIALVITEKKAINFSRITIIELFGGVGAIIGAKLLTMLSAMWREGVNILSWSGFKEAGYSYYGGLAGFFIFSKLIISFNKSDEKKYKSFVFLIPLLHMFWKFGCYLGGCCVGIPYEGALSVVFPEGTNQLAGLNVFPVQLIEALVALIISIVIGIMDKREITQAPVGWLLILYSVTRFGIEFLRYHPEGVISNGHINSVICFWAGIIVNYIKSRRLT